MQFRRSRCVVAIAALAFAGVAGCAATQVEVVDPVGERQAEAPSPTVDSQTPTPVPERTPTAVSVEMSTMAAMPTLVADNVTPDVGEGTSDSVRGERAEAASRGARAVVATATPVPTATPTSTPTATPTPTPTPTPTATPTPTPTPQPDRLYVAVGGQGRGFSADDPAGSIAEAMQRLRPGMTLEIAAGRYVGDLLVQDPPAGTAAEPIKVRTSGRVEIEGLVRFWRLVHWDIAGLNVTWPDWGANEDHLVKLTDGRHWTFRDAEIWDARSYAGLLVAGAAEHYTLSGLYVHDTIPSNDTNQDHLIYVNSTSGPGTVTRNLLVGSPNGRAIKVGGPASGDVVADVEISYNTMVDNRGPSNVQVSGFTFNVTIHHNVMVGSGERRNSITAYDFRGDDVVAYDNVFWDAAGIADIEIFDRGGNRLVDPEFDSTYRPTSAEVSGVGHLSG